MLDATVSVDMCILVLTLTLAGERNKPYMLTNGHGVLY